MSSSFPVEKGSYALWLALEEAVCLPVGRLGMVDFPRGDYLYLGSARGSGGLRGRLGHHLQGLARPHWHIDYLRKAAAIRGVFYAVTVEPLECVWSKALSQVRGAQIPGAGFGSSDCRGGCPAHLVCFPEGLVLADVLAVLVQGGQVAIQYEVIHQP